MIRRLATLATLASLTLSSARAVAADPPPDAATQRMRAHFHDGVAAYDAKDYARALAEFRAAYAEKASPIIKQNIALCLRALGRYVEAIDALESMLAEGGDALARPVRDQAAKAIAEMLAAIATAKIVVTTPGPQAAPPASSDLYIDDAPLAVDKRAAPIRLDPGSHSFRAHADGFIDAVKDVVFSAGQRDIVVSLELVPVAIVAPPVIGGPAGGNDVHDVAAKPAPIAPAPPPLPAPATARPPPRRFFVRGGLTLESEAFTLSPALDEPPAGGRHTFGGAGGVLEIGRRWRHVDLGALVELGAMQVHSYGSPNAPNQEARVDVVDWVLAPELRLRSGGAFHAIGAVAVGLEGDSLSATLGESSGANQEIKGSGVGVMGLVEGGLGLDLDKATVEATLFVDAHDVRGAKESSGSDAGARLFYDSPSVRGGLRLMVGFSF